MSDEKRATLPAHPKGWKDHEAAEVARLAGAGATWDLIARVLQGRVCTLQKRYGDEFRAGIEQANVAVAEKLYDTALRGNVVAMIFWLKTRAHWKETQRVETADVTTPDVDKARAKVEALLARRLGGGRDIEVTAEPVPPAEGAAP